MDKLKEHFFVNSFAEVYNELTEKGEYECYSVFLASLCNTLAQLIPEDRADFFEEMEDIKNILKDSVFEDYADFHSFLLSTIKESESS